MGSSLCRRSRLNGIILQEQKAVRLLLGAVYARTSMHGELCECVVRAVCAAWPARRSN